MKLPSRKVLTALAAGVTIGLVGKFGVMLVNYWASGVPSLPPARFLWLLGETFSAENADVSDQLSFAIVDANTWFVNVVIPASVGASLGLLLGPFRRISLRTVCVAVVTFALFELLWTCCTLQLSEVLGILLFMFCLAGALRMAYSARQRITQWLEPTSARSATTQS
jgi:hypothetical protein